jgi:hypothetical protein
MTTVIIKSSDTADQVQRSLLRWVALWSPLETRSPRPFCRMCDSRRYLVVPASRLFSLSYGGGRIRAWHTGTTSTTFCRSDDPKRLGTRVAGQVRFPP